jgi:hypothetical protein
LDYGDAEFGHVRVADRKSSIFYQGLKPFYCAA